MSHTLTTMAEVRPDHTLVVTVPSSIPPGRVRVRVTVESAETPRAMTPREFLASEFFGILAEDDGFPRTTDEFIEWRRKLWERPQT